MRTGLAFLVLLATASPVLALQKVDRSTQLTEKSFPTVRDQVLLKSSEASWQQIPWRPDLGEAIRESREKDKPILLWMMNGHPCGMT